MFSRHKSPTVTARKQLISSRKCSRGSSETALLQAHPTSSEIFWEERREQTLLLPSNLIYKQFTFVLRAPNMSTKEPPPKNQPSFGMREEANSGGEM